MSDATLLSLAEQCGVEFVEAIGPTPQHCTGHDGIRLSYLDWGGNADPIIFLHGGALTAHTWDLVCLGLRDRYHCLALDLRGHGDSDWAEDYRIETAVDDVAGLAALVPEQRIHIVGMSLGGTIAAHFAAKYPSRTASLTLVDVGPDVDFEASRTMRDYVEETDGIPSMDAALSEALKVNPHGNRDKIAYRLLHSMEQCADGRFHWKQDRRQPHDYDHILGKLTELKAIAKDIECPVLVVRGARSRIFSDEAAARCAGLFQHGEWTRIPEAGHNVQEDNPAALIDALMLFL